MRAQHGLRERLERAQVVGVETAAPDQLGAEARDRFGVLQTRWAWAAVRPRGLGHRGVEQRTGANALDRARPGRQ
jgi:hypothetical protein